MIKLNMSSFTLAESENDKIIVAKAVAKDNPEKYTDLFLNSIRDAVADKLTVKDKETVEKMLWLSVYYYFAYGCSTEEFFMWDLLHKTHEQANNYVTIHKKKFYRDYLNDPKDFYLLNDKYCAYELFKDAYRRDVICIKEEADYPVFCDFVHKHQAFVVKPRSLMQGHGVFATKVESLDDSSLRGFFKKLLDKGIEYTHTFIGYHDSALVLEELINQDASIAKFHPASVNGIRITTVRVNDKVYAYKPWFKIGRGGQFITSATYNTYDAGIDSETGVVYTPGATENREFAEVHPDTGERILGFQIPRWDEAIAFVTELAKKLDSIRFVGWDIVLTPDGWCVMEGNPNGAYMWQLYEDKGDQAEFEELIGWRLKKDFWWQE
ncbi:MAG: hypothetical protein IKP00_03745 [Victivallales bacterium]|nr:hypothetical protein [Victivallales bacterium]